MSELKIMAKARAWVMLVSASFFTWGCGGSRGSADADHLATESWLTNPGGAITYSAVNVAYQGAVSGLGSVVVNGVRFETTDAIIYESDDFNTSYDSNAPQYTGALEVGMTLSLFGEADDTQKIGRAKRIRIIGGARGALKDINTQDMTLTLQTQVVQLSAATTYGGTSDGTPSSQAVTQLQQLVALKDSHPTVNVYGMTQSDGRLLASRVTVIDPASHAMDVAVRGQIAAIQNTSYVINVGSGQSITVSCASECVTQPSGLSPSVGDPVRVLAVDASKWDATTSTLTASRVQLLSPSQVTRFSGAPSPSTYSKIKGLATQVGSKWRIGGVEVIGGTFTEGLFYEVKGTWNNNSLVVSSQEQEGSKNFTDSRGQTRNYLNEFYGSVSNVNGNTFNIQGVAVNASSAEFINGTLADLRDGVYVEVKGNLQDGVVAAVRVEFKSTSSNSSPGAGRVYEVFGLVSQWSGLGQPFQITRNGVSFMANTSASTQFKSRQPANGEFIEAKGYVDSNQVFQVIKLEIKSHGDD